MNLKFLLKNNMHSFFKTVRLSKSSFVRSPRLGLISFIKADHIFGARCNNNNWQFRLFPSCIFPRITGSTKNIATLGDLRGC